MIYKIMRQQEWLQFQQTGQYTGSLDDQRDGFIHFSTRDQLPGTLAKHYANEDAVIIVSVDEQQIEPKLKWEVSRGGQEFPHLFADLSLSSVQNNWTIAYAPNGFDLAALDESP